MLASPDARTDDTTGTVRRNIAPTAAPGQVIARVGERSITVDQLQRPLMEAYGVQFLVQLAQIEVARQQATTMGLSVSADDIKRERQLTVDELFKDLIQTDGLRMTDVEKEQFRKTEQERLLPQVLDRYHVTLAEFELNLQYKAYLRKIAEAQVKDKITDKELQDAFRIKYGERIVVRHIQCANLAEWVEAKRRVIAGEPFEKVAAELSRDEGSRANGGRIPSFSASEPKWPKKFVEAAFELQNPGDLSDAVNSGQALHLIQLVERIAPSNGVRFEDHREDLRREMLKTAIAVRMSQKHLPAEIAAETLRSLNILDPSLKERYEALSARARGETGGTPDDIRARIEQDRLGSPATQPGATSTPENPPAGLGEVARPPATAPGR